MLRAAERSGRVHAVGHLRRFFPAHQAADRLLRRSAIGHIVCVTVSLCAWPRPTFPDSAWDWLVRRERGGGVLGLHGTHCFDLLAWWLGEIEAVACHTATVLPFRTQPGTTRRLQVTSEDTAACLLRFVEGPVAAVILSVSTPQGAGSRIEIQGTQGRLLIEGADRLHLARGLGRTAMRPVALPREDETIPAAPGELRPYTHLLQAFLDAIGGRPGPAPAYPTFRDGYRSVAVMEACRRSHAAGRWIPVPPE
jgi:predicted dehydrogenase